MYVSTIKQLGEEEQAVAEFLHYHSFITVYILIKPAHNIESVVVATEPNSWTL